MFGKHKNALIIAIISLAVVIICLLGVFLIKPDKTVMAISELESMSNSIRKNYKNSPGYWGLDTKLVIKNNLVSNIKDGNIINILGKETVVGYDFDATTLMPGSKTFDITYKDLSLKECIGLASFEMSEEQNQSIIAIMIKSGDKVEEFSWGGDNKLPISINLAKRFCKDKNDILWRFE